MNPIFTLNVETMEFQKGVEIVKIKTPKGEFPGIQLGNKKYIPANIPQDRKEELEWTGKVHFNSASPEETLKGRLRIKTYNGQPETWRREALIVIPTPINQVLGARTGETRLTKAGYIWEHRPFPGEILLDFVRGGCIALVRQEEVFTVKPKWRINPYYYLINDGELENIPATEF